MKGRVLGLDSGGTKTVAVVADVSGAILARTDAAGLDPTAGSGWEERLRAIAEALGAVEAAVIGLPYHTEIPDVSRRQAELVRALFRPHGEAFNDVAVAFEGAFAGEDGVLILAGTGSMAWARGPAGTHRVGGWGDAFGDEGSAYWIGREALSLASYHFDGRRSAPDFAEALMLCIGVAPDELIAWTYERPNLRVAIAGVAAAVSTLAEAGEPDASILLERAAGHLADLGLTAARRCGAPAPLRWSLAGGVMASPTLRAALTRAMGAPPIPCRLSPVGGAVLLAARAAGWAADASFVGQLGRSLSYQAGTRSTPSFAHDRLVEASR